MITELDSQIETMKTNLPLVLPQITSNPAYTNNSLFKKILPCMFWSNLLIMTRASIEKNPPPKNTCSLDMKFANDIEEILKVKTCISSQAKSASDLSLTKSEVQLGFSCFNSMLEKLKTDGIVQ
jgi:hypothetical protein